MDWTWDKRENAKSRLTSEQLEEWQGHFLVGMDGMGVVRAGRESQVFYFEYQVNSTYPSGDAEKANNYPGLEFWEAF